MNVSIIGKRGQPSNVSKFPGVVDEVAEFIKQSGFSALSRRRTETAYSSGVTIKQIQSHLYQKSPALKEHKISLTTICRMFNAPNKNDCCSIRYKGYVDVKVEAKSNNYREYNPDAHYLFAANKMRRELAALYPNDVAILSVDDIAKVKAGPPTISRYHQVKRFLMSNDSPNLPDHDFPV